MNGTTFRLSAAALVAAAGFAAALPAAAKDVHLDGTIFLSGGGASPSGRCAPALTIYNVDVTTTHSTWGSFVFNSSECIVPPPPTTTYDGEFSFAFTKGTLYGTTYSVLTDSGTPAVFNLDGQFVVTGGTGAYLGATGVLEKRGLLDRRDFPPDASALIGFVGTVTMVPEPGTYGLMLAGIAVFAVGARCRRGTTG